MAAPYTIGPFYPVIPLSDARGSAARAERASSPVLPKAHAGNQMVVSSRGTIPVNNAYSWNTTKLPCGEALNTRLAARQSRRAPVGVTIHGQQAEISEFLQRDFRPSGRISEQESGLNYATRLIQVQTRGAKRKSRRGVEVGDVNDGEVATKEKGILHKRRSHSE
jgi:hypothetical protein